jgi:curli biogenesis system outer membrane secretion channel CsgG
MCALAMAVALLAACSKKDAEVAATAPAPTASAPPAAERPKSGVPDVGGVTKVSREVEAIGSTQELAVLAALQSAVAQVNGVRVASQLQSVRAGLDVAVDGQSAGSARAQAFMHKLLAASQGAVTGYEILSQEEIDKLDEETVAKVKASDGGYSYSASASADATASVDRRADASLQVGADSAQASGRYTGSASYSEKANVDVKRGASSYASDYSQKKFSSYWKVRVRVDVAQYRAPDEQGRPKIVVSMPKASSASYAVGDGKVDAAEVSRAVRARLSDILTQTKRFIVLDREYGSELQAEIDHINSGKVRGQDSARLGQQLATDLILIPSIERFEYLRHERKLRMSERQLVSYSGGARITLRLVNAATGAVVMSDSFDHKLESADPSTMPRVIDGNSMAAEMMNALSARIGGAVVTEMFPVMVVSMTGDQVVLSQGGQSLQAGQRWRLVSLGEEMKDPQTGQPLGRVEQACCEVVIERVSSSLSYGRIENAMASLDTLTAGKLQLRGLVNTAVAAKADKADAEEPTVTPKAGAAESAPAPTRKTASRSAGQLTVAATGEPAQRRDEDKW